MTAHNARVLVSVAPPSQQPIHIDSNHKCGHYAKITAQPSYYYGLHYLLANGIFQELFWGYLSLNKGSQACSCIGAPVHLLTIKKLFADCVSAAQYPVKSEVGHIKTLGTWEPTDNMGSIALACIAHKYTRIVYNV